MDKDDRTPLFLACQQGSLEIVKHLVEEKAEKEAKDEMNENHLLCASEFGNLEIVKYLVQRKANVNAKNKFQETALHLSAENGQSEIVNYLIEDGHADINIKNVNDETALHLASKRGYLSIVQCLVSYGADLKATTKLGETALHLAKRKRFPEIEEYLKRQADQRDGKKIFKYKSLRYSQEPRALFFIKFYFSTTFLQLIYNHFDSNLSISTCQWIRFKSKLCEMAPTWILEDCR